LTWPRNFGPPSRGETCTRRSPTLRRLHTAWRTPSKGEQSTHTCADDIVTLAGFVPRAHGLPASLTAIKARCEEVAPPHFRGGLQLKEFEKETLQAMLDAFASHSHCPQPASRRLIGGKTEALGATTRKKSCEARGGVSGRAVRSEQVCQAAGRYDDTMAWYRCISARQTWVASEYGRRQTLTLHYSAYVIQGMYWKRYGHTLVRRKMENDFARVWDERAATSYYVRNLSRWTASPRSRHTIQRSPAIRIAEDC